MAGFMGTARVSAASNPAHGLGGAFSDFTNDEYRR
jgi:hypothetical protein